MIEQEDYQISLSDLDTCFGRTLSVLSQVGGGRDFARVIEETVKVADESIPSVQVPKTGWTKSGCFYDELGRWSVAWRVHDAQFWGVPQRRKRIALVADFGGLSASEILFERKGLQWDSDEVCGEKPAVAAAIGTDIKSSSDSTRGQFTSITLENHLHDNRLKVQGDGSIVQTLTQHMGTGGNNVPFVLERHTFTQEAFAVYQEKETSPTLRASGGVYGGGSETLVCDKAIRKLTPLECERLQGFPDHWTDVGGASDTVRYKALGNSIALPYWKVLARRISAQYDRDVTIGSLFDGIGGFPLAFEHCGGKALWASEIEPFPTTVTKYHFGDE